MTHKIILLLIGISISITQITSILPNQAPQLETYKQWNLINYNFPWGWPSDDKDFYNPEGIVATGIDVAHNRMFVATPRLFSGVPATLSAISNVYSGDSPIFEAYPDWSHHAAGQRQYNCSDIGLVSVYRLRIDSCNRLWALDAGVSRSLEDFEVTCPPKILIYDLNTDTVVRRIDFPPGVIRGETLLTNMIIDATMSQPGGNCDDVFVYMTDTVAAGIVVYDSGRDFTWRLTHPAMYPDPDFGEVTIGKEKFTLMDGVVGIAFDPKSQIIYFQPLATDRLFSITTAALKAGPLDIGVDLPVKLVGRKSSQGIGLAVSPTGSIYFSPMTETAVAEWNPHTNTQNVLAYDPEQLQFAADIRTTDRDPSNLYVLTSKFHRFYLKNLNVDEVNTRVLRIQVGTPLRKDYQSNGGFTFGFNNQFNQPKLSGYNYARKPANDISTSYESSSTVKSISKPESYVQTFMNNLQQPYIYEPIAFVNKYNNNPFVSYNTERSSRYYPNQGLYKGRVAKRASFNITSLH